MHIVLVTAYFRPHIGGIERFSETLAHGLSRRGHEVEVVCCRTEAHAPLVECLDGYRVSRIPASNLAERRVGVPYPVPQPLALGQRLSAAIRRADVVHVQDSLYASSLPALLIAKRRRIPSVLTQHVAFVPQRRRSLDIVERVALSTVGRCARLADVVATVNPTVAEWATAFWGLKDVRNLPIGVPPVEVPTQSKADSRRSFGLPADRFLALFVGRNVHKKGLDIFAASTDARYDLLAVTDAPAVEGATVIPFMPHESLQRLYGCVDAFVLSSRDDGMPVALQEAFAHGLPVVTTRIPGLDRYISDEDVLFVDKEPAAIRTALCCVASDPALRARLSERSLAVALTHFSVDASVTAYESLYAEVVARRAVI